MEHVLDGDQCLMEDAVEERECVDGNASQQSFENKTTWLDKRSCILYIRYIFSFVFIPMAEFREQFPKI